MIIPLRPLLSRLQQCQMHTPIPRPLKELLINIIPNPPPKEQQPNPHDIRITELLPGKERPVSLLQQLRRLLQERGGLLPRLWVRTLVQHLLARPVPVLLATLAEEPGRDEREEDGEEGCHDLADEGSQFLHNRRVQVQGRVGVPGFEGCGDFVGVHYPGAVWEGDGGDCVAAVRVGVDTGVRLVGLLKKGGMGDLLVLDSWLDVGVFGLARMVSRLCGLWPPFESQLTQ